MNLLNKDVLYEVLKEPTLESFRILLQNHMGEEEQLDFKKEWEDNEKISKHLLAMANSGGGCIVFGVCQKDDGSFETEGLLNELKDDADLRKGVKKFIPDTLKFYLKDFKYESSEYEKLKNKKFQILIVENNPKNLPYICCKDGSCIKDGDIYIRNGSESRKATNYQVEKIIEKKLIACKVPRKKDMTLKQHLEQLDVLYNELTYTSVEGNVFSGLTKALEPLTRQLSGKVVIKRKGNYPKEDYDDFILNILNKKKKRIEEELDL
ncbi:MAG: helix-turn-helix domain-containing protein [Clostridia bacterium]